MRSAWFSLALLGCSPARAPIDTAPLRDVFVVSRMENSRVLLSRREDPAPALGATYALLSTAGYHGLVRVIDDYGPDNDDGPQSHRVAVRLDDLPLPSEPMIALGPTNGALTGARLLRVAAPHFPPKTKPVTEYAIDFNGDGLTDAEVRMRCTVENDGMCVEVCRALFMHSGVHWISRGELCGSGAMGG
jgi:hypothetical protein